MKQEKYLINILRLFTVVLKSKYKYFKIYVT
jgi:hypothetical protein